MKELNKFNFFILILFVLLSLFSCKKENEDDEAIRFQLYNLEKVGWKSKVHTQKIEDIGFTATEVPIQYYLLKSEGNQDLFKIDSIYKVNQTERVVEFVFQQEEEKDLLDSKFTGISYEDGLKYLSFQINNDFKIVTSKKDTIQCSGVSYERTYKIAPYQKILLFFSGIDPNEKVQLLYNDKLFRKGTLKFQFKDPYTEIKL